MLLTVCSVVLILVWLVSGGAFYVKSRRLKQIKEDILVLGADITTLQEGRKGLGLAFTFYFASLISIPFVLACQLQNTFGQPISEPSGTALLYETRSILGYGETLAVASVAVFLPLLIFLWNSSQESVARVIEDLVKLCKEVAPSTNLPDSFSRVMTRASDEKSCIDKLGEAIRIALIDSEYLRAIGNSLRGPFTFSIIWTFVLFAGLIGINFLRWWPIGRLYNVYVIMILFKSMASAIFLWLLTLLSIYLWLVQPVVRETRYLEIFQMKEMCIQEDPEVLHEQMDP